MAEDAENLSDTSRIDPVLDPELQTFTTLSRPEDPLQKVEMDLLVATLAKAQEMRLNQEQTDGLKSVVRALHLQVATSNSSREECYAAFKTSLISICVHRPPYSTGLLTPIQAREIHTWMLQAYMTNFNLYRLCYRDRLPAKSAQPEQEIEASVGVPPESIPGLSREPSGVQDEMQQRIQLAVAAELVRIQSRMNSQTLALQTRVAELEAKLT